MSKPHLPPLDLRKAGARAAARLMPMEEDPGLEDRVRRLVRCSLFAPAPRFSRLRRQIGKPAVLARWQRWLATRRPASRSAPHPSASQGGMMRSLDSRSRASSTLSLSASSSVRSMRASAKAMREAASAVASFGSIGGSLMGGTLARRAESAQAPEAA